MTKKKKVLIAGGGIGGLTAASHLLKTGFEVDLFEQAPKIVEVGAGIQLSANAAHVLHDLGLEKRLLKVAVLPDSYDFKLFDSGEVIQKISLGETHKNKHGAPYYQLHRADLLHILLEKLQESDPTAIHLNKEAIGFDEDAEGVTLKFADGTKARGDVLLGFDGIKSVIRKQIVGSAEAEYTGQVAWRFIAPVKRLPKNFMEKNMVLWVGPKRHAVIYYLRNGELLNFVGCVDHQEWSEESWTIKRPLSELKADFEGWHPSIQTMIDAADPDQCYRWSLNDRTPITQWSTKRATLLGDAAHPALPYMAQGAAMAIEDSAVIARALQMSEDIEECLDIYQRNRNERTTRVVNESRANRTLFHLNSTEELKKAFAKRNLAAERSQWLFSYNALTVDLI